MERGKPLSALVCVLRNASVQQGARGARTEKKFWRPRVGVASIERAMSSDFRVESWRFLGGDSRKVAF